MGVRSPRLLRPTSRVSPLSDLGRAGWPRSRWAPRLSALRPLVSRPIRTEVRGMRLEIGRDDLVQLVVKQVGNLFMIRNTAEVDLLATATDLALERCEHCFSHTKNKYYHRDNETY